MKFLFILLTLLCPALGLLVWSEAPAAAPPTSLEAQVALPLLEAAAQDCSSAQAALQSSSLQSDPSQADIYGWLLFIYVNCPLQADAPSPLTWESWRPTNTVYLPGGEAPAPWGSPLPSRSLLNDNPEISGFQLRDGQGQPILYEIRMNEATFNYIVQRELYSRAGQLAFFNAPASDPVGAPIQFPADAIEVKAAWIILDPDSPDLSRYYTTQAQYLDANQQMQDVLVGLAGLHISSKLLPNWLWVTFEQVDNPQVTAIPERLPTPPEVQALNDNMHQLYPADSVWRYYNMRGTQVAFTNADGSPSLLANTLIETNFQESSSCITCHALATRGAQSQGRLGFWDVSNSGIAGYVGELSANQFYDSEDNPVCYDARQDAFNACGATVLVYKQMDFVWSLAEAQ